MSSIITKETLQTPETLKKTYNAIYFSQPDPNEKELEQMASILQSVVDFAHASPAKERLLLQIGRNASKLGDMKRTIEQQYARDGYIVESIKHSFHNRDADTALVLMCVDKEGSEEERGLATYKLKHKVDFRGFTAGDLAKTEHKILRDFREADRMTAIGRAKLETALAAALKWQKLSRAQAQNLSIEGARYFIGAAKTGALNAMLFSAEAQMRIDAIPSLQLTVNRGISKTRSAVVSKIGHGFKRLTSGLFASAGLLPMAG